MDYSNKGKLYLIPTVLAPETHDFSLSQEVIRVIKDVNYFFVENLRTTRRFISSLKIDKVIDEIHFIQLDKDSEIEELYDHFQFLQSGTDMGVLSESGCPGIADPGSLAVGLAHEMGIKVIPLVGPSSLLLALMASGFNGQQFTFNGYLPIEKHERKRAIKALENEVLRTNFTQIFIETPYRNDKMLSELISVLNPGTRLCVAANLTAPDEFILTLPVLKWKKLRKTIGKVPAIFLIGQ